MYPVDYGIHGFLGVQLVALVSLALSLGITAGAWWLGVPTGYVVAVFLLVAAVLLLPFWQVFAALHPEHDDA